VLLIIFFDLNATNNKEKKNPTELVIMKTKE